MSVANETLHANLLPWNRIQKPTAEHFAEAHDQVAESLEQLGDLMLKHRCDARLVFDIRQLQALFESVSKQFELAPTPKDLT